MSDYHEWLTVAAEALVSPSFRARNAPLSMELTQKRLKSGFVGKDYDSSIHPDRENVATPRPAAATVFTELYTKATVPVHGRYRYYPAGGWVVPLYPSSSGPVKTSQAVAASDWVGVDSRVVAFDYIIMHVDPTRLLEPRFAGSASPPRSNQTGLLSSKDLLPNDQSLSDALLTFGQFFVEISAVGKVTPGYRTGTVGLNNVKVRCLPFVLISNRVKPDGGLLGVGLPHRSQL